MKDKIEVLKKKSIEIHATPSFFGDQVTLWVSSKKRGELQFWLPLKLEEVDKVIKMLKLAKKRAKKYKRTWSRV